MASPENVKFGEDDLGVFLIETITTGLYKNKLNIIREYVQNETDTDIADEVRVDIKGRDVVISGNGSGMNPEEIIEATRIGFPTKDPTVGPEAGFRHIGMWSGVSCCDTIYITSKKKRGKSFLQLKINAKGLRGEVDALSRKPLLKVLSEHVTLARFPVPKEDRLKHGTSVILSNVTPEYIELLDEDLVKTYLQRTAPVAVNPDFEFHDAIRELLDVNVSTYRTFSILLNGEPVYRPPLIKKGVLSSPEDFEKDMGGKDPCAYGWVCHKKKPGRISDSHSRGLVYKWKNWTIGDANTTSNLFKTEPTRANWMVGEVHINDIRGIRPNSQKDNFEPSESAAAVEEWLATSIWKRLRSRVHKTSATHKAIGRHKDGEKLTEDVPEYEDADEWKDYVYELQDLAKNLKRDIKNSNVRDSVKRKLRRMVKRINAHLKKTDKAFEKWKKSEAEVPVEEAGSLPEAVEENEEPEEEEGLEEEEAETAPEEVASILEEISPYLDSFLRRNKLSDDQIIVIRALSRVLASSLRFPVEKVAEFLDFLEFELSAESD